MRIALEARLTSLATDMAQRLEQVKGELRQETADRLNRAFQEVLTCLERQLSTGRDEQRQALSQGILQLEQRFQTLQGATEQRLGVLAATQEESLAKSRAELAEALRMTSDTLSRQLTLLTGQTRESLESIRSQVDEKLILIGDQVQQKLDQNIKEGFQQFEKVQLHLRAAEEQLRNVGSLGASINDLNNLLKMPHLRGRFGEVSLERLLEDFLPAHMYELQTSPGANGPERADAVIKFPERTLPVDAKFPREQVLALFETSDPDALKAARAQLAKVLKEEGRRIEAYIQPENGTMDMALMYLPSETLYMEAVTNSEVSEWLNEHKVFAVSPNTFIVTLQSISMVFKMYEFAKGYEKATDELKRAQRSFALFEKRFDQIGNSLSKAQESYHVAANHLGRYRNRVVTLSGEPIPELEADIEAHASADD